MNLICIYKTNIRGFHLFVSKKKWLITNLHIHTVPDPGTSLGSITITFTSHLNLQNLKTTVYLSLKDPKDSKLTLLFPIFLPQVIYILLTVLTLT